MEELIVNLHMHTPYSDGSGSHAEIGQAALRCGADVVIVTDHNVLVSGLETYYSNAGHKSLLLVGEEVHDRTRKPQKNHLLVFGADREMTTYSPDPQKLIDKVNAANGLCFIAHPTDPELRAFGEDDISWINWDVQGFTGLELWNGFSELKNVVHNKLQGIFYAFFPQFMAHAPLTPTVKKWDELHKSGQRIVAVGGSDAHALHMSLGPLHRTLFPYEFHFRAINTHVLTPSALSGDILQDRKMIFQALRSGHCFIGYDLPASTRGFSFVAHGKDRTAVMGDDIPLDNGLTLRIRLPQPEICRLLRNGEVIKTWNEQDTITYNINQPGVYRVEVDITYLWQPRRWIVSNPIYVLGTAR